jgi:RimJ/RimL family protein N-acetyltransferase
MIWSRRRVRTVPAPPRPAICGYGRHSRRTESLLIHTPENRLDLLAAAATGSDPDAQRWLGWKDDEILADERIRETLLRLRPADAASRPPSPGIQRLVAKTYDPSPKQAIILIAVRLDDGRYAGALGLHPGSGEVGAHLAPHSRGQGLGVQLFQAGAVLGHTHCGLRTVRAGYEPANTTSARALAKAGFVPDDGPTRHTLPNGREIEARWMRHTASAPTSRCRGAEPAAPSDHLERPDSEGRQ